MAGTHMAVTRMASIHMAVTHMAGTPIVRHKCCGLSVFGDARCPLGVCCLLMALCDMMLHHAAGTSIEARSCSQLTSKTPETFLDLSDDGDTLSSLGFGNGTWVLLPPCCSVLTTGSPRQSVRTCTWRPVHHKISKCCPGLCFAGPSGGWLRRQRTHMQGTGR
jgi:hypothetical protein